MQSHRPSILSLFANLQKVPVPQNQHSPHQILQPTEGSSQNFCPQSSQSPHADLKFHTSLQQPVDPTILRIKANSLLQSSQTERVFCVFLQTWCAHLLTMEKYVFGFFFNPQTKLSERENQYVLRKIQINNAENTMKSLQSDVEELAERVCIWFLRLTSMRDLASVRLASHK